MCAIYPFSGREAESILQRGLFFGLWWMPHVKLDIRKPARDNGNDWMEFQKGQESLRHVSRFAVSDKVTGLPSMPEASASRSDPGSIPVPRSEEEVMLPRKVLGKAGTHRQEFTAAIWPDASNFLYHLVTGVTK